jgi:hypothetical protein
VDYRGSCIYIGRILLRLTFYFQCILHLFSLDLFICALRASGAPRERPLSLKSLLLSNIGPIPVHIQMDSHISCIIYASPILQAWGLLERLSILKMVQHPVTGRVLYVNG